METIARRPPSRRHRDQGDEMTAEAERFLIDETGAVTVDWVLLTGLLVGLVLAVMNSLGIGLRGASTAMGDTLARDYTTPWF
jgi:Flp pilus assembly pilin Flp